MRSLVFVLFGLCSFWCSKVIAQCDVKNKLSADGSMMYYFEPAVFYTTQAKSLKINVLTDKEHYFIALQPTPFPPKKEGKKIKGDLIMHLSDNNVYKLSHYDTQYMDNDSIMQVLYLINENDLASFSKNEAISAEIKMEGTEFIREYKFKLHKDAIIKQLNCFLKKDEE
ncbi:hypothetical protein BD847_3958 [Flavobacterium cutihirudinis]|uniref:Uncharacterized protein n=1 Tax=Flavobacterium cutihirudinis TaxID=1265740 RepID=A0A3D9FMF9_9FLAO|nr:hypothetical protein [Flavobacterium cutihirudinis]RED19671.1 hypothetical protein BD847_3958 [Flavobacterium cutihirudinis]